MKLIFTLLKHQHLQTLTIAIIFVISSTGIQAQAPCSSPNTVIYGLNDNGVIYPVTLSNANVGTKLNTATGSPNQANGIGYSNLSATFYYFNVNPGTSGTQKFVSYAYNALLNSWSYNTLAASPTTATVHAGCVSFNGLGYYCTDVNGKLYYYNILLNSWKTITSNIIDQFGNNVSSVIQDQNSGDMAIDGLGNLWIVTSSGSNWALYEIKAPLPTTVTGTVTAKQIIAPSAATPSNNSFQGIAFNASGNMYLSTSDDKLYRLTSSSASSLSLIGTFNVNGVGNDLTSCSFPISILPVTWVDFTASIHQNNSVSLSWTVTQSINSKGFYVERSIDNKTWESIGFVADNSGEAFGEVSYSFSDANPAPQTNYYRIHQVDNDDASLYSVIKSVSLTSNAPVSVWPNPVRSSVFIQNDGTDNNVKMQIIDQLGKMIGASTLHTGKNEINISNFPAGTYIIHMQKSDGDVENQKIVKL